MKLLLALLFLVAIASCAQPLGKGLRKKLQTAATIHCSDPSSHSRSKLQNYLKTYESLGNKQEQAAQFARGVLDGSVGCQASQSKKAVTSDGVTLSCSTTPVNVGTSTATVACTYNIEIDSGIYYSIVYAEIEVNGESISSYPSNYYYYDSLASQTTLNETATITLPQYAPNGTWTFYGYAYGLDYEEYVYGSTSFYVEATLNDIAPPVLRSVSFPIVDTVSSTQLSVSFHATDDLSGVEEFYAEFYDSTYTVYLGYAYWEASIEGERNVSTTTSYGYLENVAFQTYYATIYLYDYIGFYTYYEPSVLASLGLQSTIINAGNNCTAGKYLPAGATGACLTCPAGTYSPFGSIACTPCPPGYKGEGKGASACIACGAGNYSIGGSAGCNPCPAGKYSSQAGTAVCTPCYPGSNSSAGATTCSECPPGTYSCGGAATCNPCAVGTYSASYYSSYCYQCQPGTYTGVVGSTSCTPCAVGTYAAKVGATSCTACASGESSPAGSYSALACSS